LLVIVLVLERCEYEQEHEHEESFGCGGAALGSLRLTSAYLALVAVSDRGAKMGGFQVLCLGGTRLAEG